MNLRSWIEESSYEETITILGDLALSVAGRISHEETRSALEKAIRDSDWRTVCDWSVDYSGRLSASDLINTRQVLGFITKLEQLPLGIDKESVAREKFLASEVKCRETNSAFTAWASGGFLFPSDVSAVLHSAQRKIANVLGRVPSFNQLSFTFGPGATSTVQKRNACSRIKLSGVPSCSANAIHILPGFFREVPHWADLHVKCTSIDEDGWVVQTVSAELAHGKLSFVPKNAKTYRTVMTEPTVNAVVQAGYGKWIANRLLSVGQDIHDQSRNQRLARVGSLTNALATLDLSSASDSIATELVAHLLPYDWYAALSECRTPTYIESKDDEPKSLAKFSSMGNGFTFPLQTLIFWALASSAEEISSPEGGKTCSVYGDDIIVTTTAVPLIKRVFDSVGFTLNMDKSYWDGSFRESCGADYYLGIDIRPFYQKRLVSFESLFVMHNFFYRNHDHELAAQIIQEIPDEMRLFGPDGYGDGHLLGGWNPRRHKRNEGWGGFLFDTYVSIGKRHKRPLPGDRVLPVYSVMLSGGGLEVGRSSSDFSFAPLPQIRDRRSGVLVLPLPGRSGYKRISVYTLNYSF